MTETSILQLSDKELAAEFGEHIAYDVLVANARKYGEEVRGILQSGETKTLKPLLEKLSQLENRIHKGNIYLAFGDIDRAINEYSQIKEGEAGFSQAQKRLVEMGVQDPQLFPEICIFIQEISIGNGEFVFQKGYPYSLINLCLDDVGLNSHYGVLDYEGPYVISLSQNKNGMQEGKLSFLCNPYHSIDDGSFDGVYANLEDLDILFHPKTILFQGVDTKGNVIFSPEGNGKRIQFPLDKVLNGFRKKDVHYEDDKTEPVIVWEEVREYVNIIQYGENHPQKILAQIRENLDYGLIGDASDMLEKLNKKSPEYKIAKDLIEEAAIESGILLLEMTENGDFPSGN